MGGAITVEVAQRGRVAQLAHVTCTLGRRDKPYPEAHEARAWTIALVRRGTFRYRAASTNRRFALRPGWLLVGRPGAEFECSHEHDGGDECASLAIGEDVLCDAAEAAGVPLARLLGAAPVMAPVARVAALVERSRARGAGAGDVDELGCRIAESVVEAACAVSPRPIAPARRDVDRVHAAVEQIERSSAEPLSVPSLAAAVGLSPFHFVRVFRRVTGTTPHQYVIGARLRLAARLLLDTDRPVTRIAYDVGFQDLSNFVRTFHRAVGASPRAYRRR